ncbi:hypothetical protein ACU8KH_00463 [Lachancea thermotolerans]
MYRFTIDVNILLCIIHDFSELESGKASKFSIKLRFSKINEYSTREALFCSKAIVWCNYIIIFF